MTRDDRYHVLKWSGKSIRELYPYGRRHRTLSDIAVLIAHAMVELSLECEGKGAHVRCMYF